MTTVARMSNLIQTLPPPWAVAPPWAEMWALAVVVFALCKWWTWRGCRVIASVWRQIAYLVAWPGLDAAAFCGQSAAPPHVAEVGFAFGKTLCGAALVCWAAARDWPGYGRGWVGMIGLVFVLHFGLFHLLSCGWRAVGVAAAPLMHWPIAATSLADFWGRRWNTAFRDLTHRHLFAPLAKRWGPRAGLALGFGFSGVVHDLVISLPARGGYGGPTLYFVLQALGLLAERSRRGRRCGLGGGAAGRSVRSRAFAAAVIVLPAPLLFHPPFVTRVIVPFLDALSRIDLGS